MTPAELQQIAEVIRHAEGLVITAGAGMGVDSGLPDFRGNAGFWRAYPPYALLGLSFIEAANPRHFEEDPQFGWGFYGQRTNLYRSTRPHRGFKLLSAWAQRFALDCFVVTSNVDGQFQKAGFAEDRILEVHGSIHHLQCTVPCSRAIWLNEEDLCIDEETMRAEQVPACPQCGRPARPNILMFGDYAWLSERTARQQQRFDDFLLHRRGAALAVIELGAGSAIPTIRHLSEALGRQENCRVIRINPREAQIGAPHFSCSGGALEILEQIDGVL